MEKRGGGRKDQRNYEKQKNVIQEIKKSILVHKHVKKASQTHKKLNKSPKERVFPHPSDWQGLER